jgi:nitrite reductase/ring-hydroxylating ferredoxin subunit
MATAQESDVRQAIVSAALDYYEGWFDGDAARMEKALHPDLVKRSLAEDGTNVETISAREMVEATAKGIGLTGDPGVDRRGIEIHVDHVYEDIATVSATSSVYVDYLQLVRTRDGWQIVNVLWDRVARPRFVTVRDGAVPEQGRLAAVEVGEERIAVANVEGALHAISDLCPHRQCSLAGGGLAGTVVTCPCHGSQFDVMTGERLRGPAVRGVQTFAVRLENGALRVEV